MIVFIVETLLLCVAQAHVISQTWIWGEGGPIFLYDRNEEIELLTEVVHHGFIRLIYKPKYERLDIDLVIRPPRLLFPEDVPFCSIMLPATISEFMDRHNLHDKIKNVHVIISATPYLAACKCYLRTMMSMGMNYISISNKSMIVTTENLEDICELEPRSITARSVSREQFANSPISVSDIHKQILQKTVTTILVDSLYS